MLSHKGTKCVTFDIKNLYLQTPLDRQKYVRIKLSDIPQDFIDKYNLQNFVNANSWVYFQISNGVYDLSQSGALAQALLEKRLNFHDYYQCPLIPGLWRHTWRPIMFFLIVHDFGVELVGKRHAIHLKQALSKHYELTEN